MSESMSDIPLCALSIEEGVYGSALIDAELISQHHAASASEVEESMNSRSLWHQTQNRISQLPTEICGIIMDMLFDSAFGPKPIHTHLEPPVTKYFLALNQSLYAKYVQIYWSQNTWIVGPGPASTSMRFMTLPPSPKFTTTHSSTTAPATEFSLQPPNLSALRIRHTHLAFTLSDLPSRPPSPRLNLSCSTSTSPTNSSTRSASTQTCHKASTLALLQIWQDKFDRVAFLDLETLVLDFSEAYSPDGGFLGVDAVQRFMPFVSGLPRVLEVRAPGKGWEGEIRGVLGRVNRIGGGGCAE